MVSGTITTANNTSLSSKERVSSSHKSVASSSSTQEEDSGTDFCIYPLSTKEEGKRPLSNNSRRSTPQKSIEEIKCKSVGFFVSELNVNIEKYTALNETNEKILKEFFFEILWIPMVESFEKWTDTQEKSFCTVANAMPWSWCHPSMVSKSFNSHIVEEWHYRKESTLVVLDENAKVVTTNALQMVETWGASAFPFSREMEVSISKS
ncbi:hypothetical protein IFM89_035250 [Coptis chinensis]|uniref:Uncharacterized protein n=1 Tax=Coptis chinensis TaxID=261450 RepID=A0A835MB46_9MAGN|nr:hypothetical protein IFM89_035250 [Coptis chinensis]